MVNVVVDGKLRDSFFEYADDCINRNVLIRPMRYFMGYIDALEIEGLITSVVATRSRCRVLKIDNVRRKKYKG